MPGEVAPRRSLWVGDDYFARLCVMMSHILDTWYVLSLSGCIVDNYFSTNNQQKNYDCLSLLIICAMNLESLKSKQLFDCAQIDTMLYKRQYFRSDPFRVNF